MITYCFYVFLEMLICQMQLQFFKQTDTKYEKIKVTKANLDHLQNPACHPHKNADTLQMSSDPIAVRAVSSLPNSHQTLAENTHALSSADSHSPRSLGSVIHRKQIALTSGDTKIEISDSFSHARNTRFTPRTVLRSCARCFNTPAMRSMSSRNRS